MKMLITAAVLTIAVYTVTPIVSIASAQEADLATGVIVEVEGDEAGALNAFTISDREGQRRSFTVNEDTRFGLEDASGDRWVATLADAPSEAMLRLIEHRRIFAPVTVSIEGTLALSVVETEPLRLEANLAWIGAVFAVTWAGFFIYLIWVSRRQADTAAELKRLKKGFEVNTNDEGQYT